MNKGTKIILALGAIITRISPGVVHRRFGFGLFAITDSEWRMRVWCAIFYHILQSTEFQIAMWKQANKNQTTKPIFEMTPVWHFEWAAPHVTNYLVFHPHFVLRCFRYYIYIYIYIYTENGKVDGYMFVWNQ